MIQPPERVHTMTDYYDRPREGIADYGGRPHVYRTLWADIGHDRPDVFELAPIDEATLAMALEAWQIWRRWETAFHRGETSHNTHPALPADTRRHEELKALLALHLPARSPAHVTAEAEFEWPPSDGQALGAPLHVRWTTVERPADGLAVEEDPDYLASRGS